MACLTSQQARALKNYCRECVFAWTQGFAGLPSEATRRFCEAFLRDAPWSEIWTVEDLGSLIWEVSREVDGLLTSNDQASKSASCDLWNARLRVELESYPRAYHVYVELPGLDPDLLEIERLELPEEVFVLSTSATSQEMRRLVRPEWSGDIDTSQATTLEEFRELMRPISSFLLEPDSIYLRFTEKGAMPGVLSTERPSLLSRAITRTKIFVFFGLELGLFERREIFRERHHASGNRTIVHVAVHSTSHHGQAATQLPRDFENFVRGITFPMSDAGTSPSVSQRELNERLQPVVRFMQMPSCNEHAERLAAGIEWLIDSVTAESQMMALVQACIGLEAVLGDSSPAGFELGITARLAERYAYLMGCSASERTKLKEDLRAVFAKRGDLVHARRHRLPPYEAGLVRTSQQMLQAVLRKEIALLLELSSDSLSQMDIERIRPLHNF